MKDDREDSEKTRSSGEVKRSIRMMLHRIRNPLAASHLEIQLALRSHVSLGRAINAEDASSVRRELSSLLEALEGVEQCVTETAARMDDIERDLNRDYPSKIPS